MHEKNISEIELKDISETEVEPLTASQRKHLRKELREIRDDDWSEDPEEATNRRLRWKLKRAAEHAHKLEKQISDIKAREPLEKGASPGDIRTHLSRLISDTNYLDLPSIEEPIWGEGEHQLWTPGDPLHIWGISGSGKTSGIGIPLAVARAGVGPLELGGFPVKPTPKGVMYLMWDRQRQIEKALARYSQYLDINLNEVLDLVPFNEDLKDLILNSPETYCSTCADELAVEAIFVDSLQNVIGYDFPDELLKKYLHFQKTCSNMGVDVVTLNHALKPQIHAGKEQRPTFRGSQAILDQAGTSLFIQRTADEDDHLYTKVSMDKPSVEMMDPFILQISKETGRPELYLPTPDEVDIDFNRAGPCREAVKAKLLKLLKEQYPETLNTRKLRIAMGGNTTDTEKAKQELLDAGLIEVTDGPRNSKNYSYMPSP